MFPIMGATNPTGYNLTRSLRTRASASAYLSKAAYGSGGGITTWASWIKRGTLGVTNQILFTSTDRSDYYDWFGFNSSDQLTYWHRYNNSDATFSTSAVFRDPSAWYFIQVVIDSTQASNANRVKIYVNGTQQTLTVSGTFTQNQGIRVFSSSSATNICGTSAYITSNYFDGYLAEINLIDGQALTPSSFGSTNTLTGVWQPARYGGTYGTNGFYLPFTDNSALTTSSNVGLGRDYSGNGNYWTTNNISITSGVTYDSMTDVPTLTSPTVANFATFNPLASPGLTAPSNGNLYVSSSNADNGFWQGSIYGSFQSYFEVTYSGGTQPRIGLISSNGQSPLLLNGWDGGVYSYGVFVATISSLSVGDVVGMSYNGSTWVVYLNGVASASASISPVSCTPYVYDTNGSASIAFSINFGQQPFKYSLPTGCKLLNTYNLPTSTIVKGNTVMDATLYNGTGGSQSIVNAGSFKPDLVWTKARSQADQNNLMDSVRGVGNRLFSNLTNAETTGGLVSVNSNGFSIDSSSASMNNSGQTYVGWQWQAGQGTASSNTSGTITSTVSVNASAGFSVVTYTGTGANATVGHGLGVAPQFIIIKARGNAYNWMVYSSSVGNTAALNLNLTAATTTASTWWNNTSPTSSVFTIGTDTNMNQSSATYVAYCWTPIAGYSSFGSYVGNGSTDGPFLYLGFRPKYLLLKCTTTGGAGYDWYVLDSVRNAYNYVDNYLYPNYSNAEAASGASYSFDFVSNGIKIRGNGNGQNQNGQTYAYACWAENPFKNSLAR